MLKDHNLTMYQFGLNGLRGNKQYRKFYAETAAMEERESVGDWTPTGENKEEGEKTSVYKIGNHTCLMVQLLINRECKLN